MGFVTGGIGVPVTGVLADHVGVSHALMLTSSLIVAAALLVTRIPLAALQPARAQSELGTRDGELTCSSDALRAWRSRCADDAGATVVRVTVYLETTMGLDIVREIEADPQRYRGRRARPVLEADQWTQETIARLLIPRGWALLGATDPPSRAPDEVPRSPTLRLAHRLVDPAAGLE